MLYIVVLICPVDRVGLSGTRRRAGKIAPESDLPSKKIEIDEESVRNLCGI